MSIAIKNSIEHELIHGTLFVAHDKNGFTLTFTRKLDIWTKRNVKRYLINPYYFTFIDENGALCYFLPSILMKEELIGLPFLHKYYLKRNPHEKDEMIISTFSYGEESAYIMRETTYSIIHNDCYIILGIDGYRKVIARKDQSIEEKVMISKANLYETTLISSQMLLHTPLKKDLFLKRAQNVLEDNLFQFSDI